MPNSVFEARLMARFKAFDAAREAKLDGEDDSGGAGFALGGGGKVVFAWLTSGGGYSSTEGDGGTRRSCKGRLGTESNSIVRRGSIELDPSSISACSPSTARLNSTARVSPTSTYSFRSNPSSSLSPGITELSMDKGRDAIRGRAAGLELVEDCLDLSTG